MTYSESSSGAYVLILGEKPGVRRLPIVIGGPEADAIAMGIEGEKGTRPLTHDLMLNMANEFGIRIMEVIINRFRAGVYYAGIVCQKGDDITLVDARPSDAIAIAVRVGCDIYAYENVMEEAGIVMEDMEQQETDESGDSHINKGVSQTSLDLLDLETLEDLLQEAIDDEDYQKAAEIRDEIKRRS